MSGTFTERMDMLAEQVRGTWSARCEVNQIYAHYQETHPEFNHPRGGQAFYLRDTIYHGGWLREIAQGLIDSRGVRVEAKMQAAAEGMAVGVYLRAPVEFNDLRRSGRAYVMRDQAVVFNRPPAVNRLSEVELRHKGRLRYLFERR